jgi:hypothetical protein
LTGQNVQIFAVTSQHPSFAGKSDITYQMPTNDNIPKRVRIVSARGDKQSNPFKDAKCYNSQSFYKAMSGSKYLDDYLKVDGLIEEIGNLLDKDARIVAGVVENFNLKFLDESMLIRFTVNGNKVRINNELFGKSQELNGEHDYYKKIYSKYIAYKGNDYVQSFQDVTKLLEILKSVVG